MKIVNIETLGELKRVLQILDEKGRDFLYYEEKGTNEETSVFSKTIKLKSGKTVADFFLEKGAEIAVASVFVKDVSDIRIN